MTGQRGAAAPGRDGEEELTATYDGRDDEVGLPRVVHDAHENPGAARIGTRFGIDRAVIGGRHNGRHPGEVQTPAGSEDSPGQSPPLPSRGTRSTFRDHRGQRKRLGE